MRDDTLVSAGAERFSIVQAPSAILPVIMSLAALATVLARVAIVGGAREPDEGAAAHIWQLLMLGQVPIIAFFAIKWLPRNTRQALLMLAVQLAAALAALAPVLLLGL